MNATYETIDGTDANVDEQHEPRTVRADMSEGLSHMMSEIGDGVFVAWSQCRRCLDTIKRCNCPDGPTEPKHITEWREKRFIESFRGRSVLPALPEGKRTLDRRIDAVTRLLISRGWTVEPPFKAPTKEEVIALGEESLRRHHPQLIAEGELDAVELNEAGVPAMSIVNQEVAELGLEEPDIIDPDDVEGVSDDPDHQPDELDESAWGRDHDSERPDVEQAADELNVDEGLKAALAKIKKAKEARGTDVGF